MFELNPNLAISLPHKLAHGHQNAKMPREDWPEEIPINEATIHFMTPDTSITSRADFTDFFMRFRHAPDAHALYKHIFITHQKLARLLCDHPAMRPNLQQTFDTPANSKSKV